MCGDTGTARKKQLQRAPQNTPRWQKYTTPADAWPLANLTIKPNLYSSVTANDYWLVILINDGIILPDSMPQWNMMNLHRISYALMQKRGFGIGLNQKIK